MGRGNLIERRAARATITWASLAFACLTVGPANADTSVIAVSKSQHARVLAQGSPNWCSSSLHLSLELDPDSPDRGDAPAQARLLSRLRRPIQTDCPAARQAVATVSGEPSTTFVARAEGGWNFAILQTSPPAATADKSPPAANPGRNAAPFPAPHDASTTTAASDVTAPPSFPTPEPAPLATHASPHPSDSAGIEAGAHEQLSTPAPFVLPRDLNYPSFVVALAQRNPAVLSNPETIRYWAAYRFRRDFERLANQEFELQPLLDQARRDLQQTIAATPTGRVYVTLSTQFGTYDFQRHSFPIPIGGSRLTFGMDPCCQPGDALPRSVQLDLEALDAIDSLPMGEAEAQRFAASRTRYGSIDRRIVLLLTLQLNDAGVGPLLDGQSSAAGAVQGADVLAGHNLETIVHQFPASELAELRAASARAKADAERVVRERQAAQQKEAERQQAEQERQQLLSQREGLTASLASLPPSARLRAFMTPGPNVDGRRLDNLREARADSLITRQGWNVVMLVQADGDGRSAVPTSWPKHLAVSAPTGQPALASSHWYLVAGKLAVPSGEDIPAAQLQATLIFACTRAACSDAAEPDAIVERKIASLGANTLLP
jgi:hypothetical protein